MELPSRCLAALDAVAERAGVGRATLYRNFADRNALIVAVLERCLDKLTLLVEQNADSPTLLEDFVRRQGVVAAFHAKALVGTETAALDGVVLSLRERADDLLGSVLARAIASGSVAAHVTIMDMRIVNRMLIAAATLPDVDQDDTFERALTILLNGLARDRTGK